MPRKNPQGENLLGEREYFYYQETYSKTQKFSDQLISIRKRKFLSRFSCQTGKIKLRFFFLVFVPMYKLYGPRKSCPKICLENRACYNKNCTVRTVWTNNKWCCPLLDFCALSAAVLSLDLRAANFFSFKGKMKTFSLSSFLHFNLQKRVKWPFLAFLVRTLGFI